MRKPTGSYPLRHLSVRVPWHDGGWNGTVCNAPRLNGACMRLKRIQDNRDEEAEEAVAGRPLVDLPEARWPCCVAERAMFMAPFHYERHVEHPYRQRHPRLYGHFRPTPLSHPAYSAPAVPFAWMRRETMGEYAEEHDLDVLEAREPDLGFTPEWVNEMGNQRALLDCFFAHVVPEASLCFFYAKEVPFTADPRRVIVGVGRVLNVSPTLEYHYDGEVSFRAVLWEHLVRHSIRPDHEDGFLLPYHAALQLADEEPEFDPAEVVAFAPEGTWREFSYGSEHVSHDGAIAALLSCAGSLRKASKHLEGPWDRCLKWTHDRIAELWRMRGPCPGLGSALCAFGIEHGAFVAREIEMKAGDNADPWPLIDEALRSPKQHLTDHAADGIGRTLQEKWRILPDERRELLKLISRFSITPDQAKTLYVPEVREEQGIECDDDAILRNPYLVYELTRLSADPVSIWTADRAVFPDSIIRENHPLSQPSALDGGTDTRRVRALTVNALETAASPVGSGHSLLSQKDIVLQIRGLDLEPSCEVDADLLAVAEAGFPDEVDRVELADGRPAYQLRRLAECGETIRAVVQRRLNGKRLAVDANWRETVNGHLAGKGSADVGQEERAREEKAAVLRELAESRFSVLIGRAGTGKTLQYALLVVREFECGYASACEKKWGVRGAATPARGRSLA
jgi:hypothetical protein